MSKLNIGIAGLGNVGSALIETIEKNKNYFLDKTNVELNIVGISARTKNKKRNFISSKLTENTGKPKELWKILKGLGMPSKSKATSNICLEKDGYLSFDPKENCEIFKTYFA